MDLHAFTHVDFIELGLSRFRSRARVHHLGLYCIHCKVTEDSLSNLLNTFSSHAKHLCLVWKVNLSRPLTLSLVFWKYFQNSYLQQSRNTSPINESRIYSTPGISHMHDDCIQCIPSRSLRRLFVRVRIGSIGINEPGGVSLSGLLGFESELIFLNMSSFCSCMLSN
jgi:hypothetical protein